MSIVDALLLGLIQGLTEFLPISSSGHLVIGQHLLGIDKPQLLFDIVLHAGTLLAVVAFYWSDVRGVVVGLKDGVVGWATSRSLARFARPEGARLAVLTIMATIPTGLIGVYLESKLDPPAGAAPIFTASVVAGILLVNGVILFGNRFLVDKGPVDRPGRWTLWGITPALAVAIGVAQGIAVTPGLSRSGLTITVALMLGIMRTEAARFSFLISIPAIVGALVLKFDLVAFTNAGSHQLVALGAGTLVSAAVGYGAISLLVDMLQKARFHQFAWYCWAVGLLGLAFL